MSSKRLFTCSLSFKREYAVIDSHQCVSKFKCDARLRVLLQPGVIYRETSNSREPVSEYDPPTHAHANGIFVRGHFTELTSIH